MAITNQNRSSVFHSVLSTILASNVHQSIRFSAYLVVLYAVSMSLPEIGLETTMIRAVFGFILLSFIPGLLVLRLLRDQFRPVDIIYSVAFSITFSMFIALLANSVYIQHQTFSRPFTGNTLPWIYIGVISVLILSVSYLTRERPTIYELQNISEYFREYDNRIVLTLLTLPVFGATGALFINRFGENVIALSVIAVCAALPIIAFQFDTDRRYLGLMLLVISFALVMQRALISTHLSFGDGMSEYTVANTILQVGYWIPSGTFGSMPRIGPMKAAYALVMDIPLLWQFKLTHPIVFALTPIIGYLLSARYFSKEVAFLGGILYVFLPETYRLLPRNTRTGAAIFFSVVLIAVILDDDITKRSRNLLGVVFFWAMIASHYGVGPLVMLLLFPPYVCYQIFRLLGSEPRPMIRFSSLILYVVLAFGWYAYTARDTFDFVASVLVGRALNFATPSPNTAATNALSFSMPSLSYEIFFYSHILIAVLISLGIGVIVTAHVLDLLPVQHDSISWIVEFFEVDAHGAVQNSAYLSVILGLALLFPLSFGPNVLSSARTFGLLVVFLGPFAILAMRLPKFTRIRYDLVPVFLAVFLLVSSGFAAATVTHDASRVPNFDQERIIESGDRIEQFALYRVHTPESSVVASGFIAERVPDGGRVYRSRLGGFEPRVTAFEETYPEIHGIQNVEDTRSRYVYIAEADTVTGTITTGFNGFVYYDYIELPRFSERQKVYTNGRAKLYN